jgi:aminoglycoside N3'-acetyltransferase
MHSREQLANDFRRAASDVVMLHASVRAVGEVAGGPDQILWLSPPRFWVTELKE